MDGERPAVMRLGLNLLRPGGLYVASRAGNTLHAAFAQDAPESGPPAPRLAADAFGIAHLDEAEDVVLIARRPQRNRPRRRAR